MVIRASVKPKRKESIIINSQLSPNILIMKSTSDIDTKIRGETKYATTIARIQFRINNTSFIKPLKYAKNPEKSVKPAEMKSKEERVSISLGSYNKKLS